MLLVEAAAELQMSRHALWKAVERGHVRTVRIGPLHAIERDELDRFKAERRRRGWPKGKPRKPAP